MEAASRSALEPLKDELEPLPDSDGPAPAKALNAAPAESSASNTQELVSMESLMGWSDLANRAIVETPPATDFLIPAEALREEARKLEELLDSLSNLPIGNAEASTATKAPTEAEIAATLNSITENLGVETVTAPVTDASPSQTSKAPTADLTFVETPAAAASVAVSASAAPQPPKDELLAAAALSLLEPQEMPLAPLPLELEKLPAEILPPAANPEPKPPSSETRIAEPLSPVVPAAVATAVAAAPMPNAPVRPAVVPAPPIKRAPVQSARAVAAQPAAARPAIRPVAKPAPASASVKPAVAASAVTGTAPNSTPPPAKITAYPNAPATAAAAPNVMDRDFIARNQIVERYLSGKLPVKGATDFERFCHDNPELLDEIGLPQRVHAGLRLLEASGKPEPWQQETSRRFWEKPHFVFGFMGAAIALAVLSVMLANQLSDQNASIAKLKQDLVAQPLEPAATTRIIRVLPSRDGSSNTPAVTIGGANAQLCDLRIDMSRSAFRAFRVTIDRIDQGRVAVLQNIYKDSNGHVRIALNSSALGPGNYSFTIDGVTWRGETVPDAWVTIGIQR